MIVAAAEEKKSAGEPQNLSNRQIRVYSGAMQDPDFIPVQTSAVLERNAARVRELAAGLDDAAVTPLQSAFYPGFPPESRRRPKP